MANSGLSRPPTGLEQLIYNIAGRGRRVRMLLHRQLPRPAFRHSGPLSYLRPPFTSTGWLQFQLLHFRFPEALANLYPIQREFPQRRLHRRLGPIVLGPSLIRIIIRFTPLYRRTRLPSLSLRLLLVHVRPQYQPPRRLLRIRRVGRHPPHLHPLSLISAMGLLPRENGVAAQSAAASPSPSRPPGHQAASPEDPHQTRN
jgi:hypothetical protein